MTSGGYEIGDPASLSSHASKVASVSAGVREAAAAGDQVGLGGVEAYGLLCSPLLIPALQAFQGNSDDMLRSAADLAEALAAGVKQSTTNYEDLERDLQEHFDTYGGQA
ncbi:type VII secretion target [Actinokineospora bangkokensis]|uniref:ESX-1 secretion-associated protein n=1 Tax=Actinokineospora bangkokensis TaxID=1193682 RepID=A0A1Q9LP68_9PSEU|nr:type VII secretion target [Actinokineospora bangkokensis]OLR93846.1 hypothetical protein BJP25_16620 [Actinokineospora bangkokensis]